MSDLLLGTAATGGEGAVQVSVSADARKRTHMMVLGSPGRGKSKLLQHAVQNDIWRRQGVCVLDIHGTLYEDVKRWCSYHFFLNRNIVSLDPSRGEYVKGFNPFLARPGVAVDVQVAGMVQALLRVWGAENSNETPTLDRVLRLIFTAMIVRTIPLHDAFHLINFGESGLRAEVIAAFDEPVIKAAWQQIHSLKKAGEWRAEVLSTENRLFRLVSSPTIRRFMGVVDRSFALDCLDVMNRGDVLLVNLKESSNLSEENAKAFAALLINDLFKSAIMFRDRDTLGSDPLPFYVYLDEWQNFVTPDIKKILAQARKFGLLLVLANQDLAQIREAFSSEFVDTLMTCCGIKACFGGLNRADAIRVAQEITAGQIDLAETKYVNRATRFRPVYGRDKVYGTSTMAARSGGSNYAQFDEYLGFPAVGTVAAKSNARGDSIADIPMFTPQEFSEESGTPYTLEEQLWRWSDRLQELPQRHFVAKVPGCAAQSLIVPLVKDHFVRRAVIDEFEDAIARQVSAKRPEEVDQILSAQRHFQSPEPRVERTHEDHREELVAAASSDPESPWN